MTVILRTTLFSADKRSIEGDFHIKVKNVGSKQNKIVLISKNNSTKGNCRVLTGLTV